MGRDKAFLPWGDGTLLSHALGLARQVAQEVYIVGDATKFSTFGPVVEDIFRDRGPLGGIHAALSQSSTELNLMLAVDTPFMDVRFLRYLVEKARNSQAVVCVPHSGGWQPLCAVYRREFRNMAEQSLREGKNKIDPLFGLVPVDAIEERELQEAGFLVDMFRNLNTPEDLEQTGIRP